MTALATTTRPARQSRRRPIISKDRKDIYIGDGLKRAIAGRKESLSTVVNLIADRYQGMVERMRPYVNDEQINILRAVLAETRGHRLEAREIASLAGTVQDWLKRHPSEYEQQFWVTLNDYNFAQLVALVDSLERNP